MSATMDCSSLSAELDQLGHVDDLAQGRRIAREDAQKAQSAVGYALTFLHSWEEQLAAAHRYLESDWQGGRNLPPEHPALQRIASAQAQVLWGREQLRQAQLTLGQEQCYLQQLETTVNQLDLDEQRAIRLTDLAVEERNTRASLEWFVREYQEAKATGDEYLPLLRLARQELERLPYWQRQGSQQAQQIETYDAELARASQDLREAMQKISALQDKLARLAGEAVTLRAQ
jgi:hypothetical protein